MKLIKMLLGKKKDSKDKAKGKEKRKAAALLRASMRRHRRRRLRRRFFRFGMKLSELALVGGAVWLLYDQRAVLIDKVKAKLPLKK